MPNMLAEVVTSVFTTPSALICTHFPYNRYRSEMHLDSGADQMSGNFSIGWSKLWGLIQTSGLYSQNAVV